MFYFFICTLLFSQTLNDIDLYNLGRYTAVSIIQGGSGLPCLAEYVYNYLCTGKCTSTAVCDTDIADPALLFVLDKVIKLENI